MANTNIQLNIGDEIGFVILAQGVDTTDRTVYFPVVEITTRDGQRAYRYQYPDGNISASAIRQSELKYHSLRINTVQAKPELMSLTNRIEEFLDAMERGKTSNLEVFNDWEHDSYYVKNHSENTEYNVTLTNENNEMFAHCECPDFKYRKRVCKHIGAVLSATVFGLMAKS